MEKESRYVIGIDLGTTNTALNYVDTSSANQLQDFAIPQVVGPGVVEDRPLLPSFLYLPGSNEQPRGSLKLPWDKERDYAVGEFARNFGSQVPTRLASSAKSWLCHPGVDRHAAVLPWKAPEDGRKVSPVEASTRYLKYLAEAWDQIIAKDVAAQRLKKQDIVLTVPASFDAVARELTVEAARAAGLDVTLLEEPQAAFYAWLEANGDRWRNQVKVGDVILVCDVGGGTTDLTLIGVAEEEGNLVLTRLAVGDHILLGGDNMDLTLAHHLAAGLAAKGTKLDAGQMHALWHACRAAKELLFANPKLASTPVTILGRGSKVIGGTIQTELMRKDVEKVLIDGFFPPCELDAEPARQHAAGIQELGLPYASDPAITRHLAWFLSRNVEVFTSKKKKAVAIPSAVLFNGGVFKAEPLQQRLLEVLNSWAKTAGAPAVKVLPGTHLDLAVARGAAYYGMVRRGQGVRIRGGTARSYYVGVETAMPAVPGAAPPIKALCVVPFGMEEGSETDLPGQEFGLVVGVPAQFRFLGSTLRRADTVGLLIDDWEEQITELSPIVTTLEASGKEGKTVPVHLHSKVTEVGTLELWCISRDGKHKWKLEYNVRERLE